MSKLVPLKHFQLKAGNYYQKGKETNTICHLKLREPVSDYFFESLSNKSNKRTSSERLRISISTKTSKKTKLISRARILT